jgi:hypothetical protein
VSDASLASYTVRAADVLPALEKGWNDPAWTSAGTAEVSHFRPESSAHRPRVQARLLHGPGGIRGVFHIDDRYVRSVRTGFQSPVYKDSCVEFFMQPRPDRGYFNLEMNAGGSHLCYYVEDPTRTPDGFKKLTRLSDEDGRQFRIRSSLPATVEPEITEPLAWELNFFVPLPVLEKHVGPLGALSGKTWRGNFYKCGDELSHPHWAAWAPVDALNFHLPRCFGVIHFQ